MCCNLLPPQQRHMIRPQACTGRPHRPSMAFSSGVGKLLYTKRTQESARSWSSNRIVKVSSCLGTSVHHPSLLPTHAADSQSPREMRLHSSLVLALVPSLLGDVSEGLETPVQLVYLLTLLGFLTVGAYLVVRQVLIRRELEEAAKVLGERVRLGEASAEDYFELGVVLLRKKLFTQATRNLEKAKSDWEGNPEDLAQVHNALGYAYFNMERNDLSIEEYKAAVSLQPGYVTAWNNLGNAYEKEKAYKAAYEAYREALTYAPNNSTAKQRADALKTRLDRLGLN